MKKTIQHMKKLLNGIKYLIVNYTEDILIMSGLAVIVRTTFLLSAIAGAYILGAVLLLLGIYFTNTH